MRYPLVHALAAIALTGAAAAFAQQAQPLQSRLEARKVVISEGRESLVDAANARPGDVIEYVATYRNTGKSAITGLQATLPIPHETEFIPGSARPSAAKASLDGRVFADIPLKRTVQRDGRPVEVSVPWREYRALRWSAGELGAEKTATFVARVRVTDDRAPPAAAKPGENR
ncbi:MAG: hypothetical protein AB7P08_10190 [Burkholderiales bacterium]